MDQDYNLYTHEIKTVHGHKQISFKYNNFTLPCRLISDHTPTRSTRITDIGSSGNIKTLIFIHTRVKNRLMVMKFS